MSVDVERISVAEAKARMEAGATCLDVRTEVEFAAGHPAGARNVPYALAGTGGTAPNPAFVSLCERLFAKDAPIVLTCQSGVRSLAAARLLVQAGFRRVAEMRAGWGGLRGPFGQLTEKGWLAEGLPIEKETPGGSFAELRARAGLG